MASVYDFNSREEKFSYFCKYDELPRAVACPGIRLPSLEQSLYDPDFKQRLREKFGIKNPHF